MPLARLNWGSQDLATKCVTAMLCPYLLTHYAIRSLTAPPSSSVLPMSALGCTLLEWEVRNPAPRSNFAQKF